MTAAKSFWRDGPILGSTARADGTGDIRASWWAVILLPVVFAFCTAAFTLGANLLLEERRNANALKLESRKERLARERERPEASRNPSC